MTPCAGGHFDFMQIRHFRNLDFRGLLVSDSKYFKEKHSAKKPLLAISSFWFAKILGLTRGSPDTYTNKFVNFKNAPIFETMVSTFILLNFWY